MESTTEYSAVTVAHASSNAQFEEVLSTHAYVSMNKFIGFVSASWTQFLATFTTLRLF